MRRVLGIARPFCPFVIALLTLNVVAILATGGSRAWLLVGEIRGRRLAPAVIVLCVATVLSLPLLGRRSPRAAYARHLSLLVFCLLLSVYLANDRTIWSGDTLPARYLPLSILRSGSFFLDQFTALYRDGHPYYLERVGGHYVSGFPVGAALLALPLYVPSALSSGPAGPELLEQLEKLSAAIMVALSAVVLYRTLRLLSDAPAALVLTLVYGLGTSSLSLSSQALWQHGPSQLALAAALYCLVRGRTAPRWSDASALPMAFAVICRPTDLVIVAPLALYAVVGRPWWRFTAWGLAPIVFQLWYNLTYFGHALHTQWPVLDRGLWSMSLSEGLAGMLFSPGRGLFVYSPVLLFSLVGMARVWRRGGDAFLRVLSVGVVGHVLLYSMWWAWHAGLYYGPRYHADLTPALTVLIVPVVDWLRHGMVRCLFVALALWSFAAHLLGIVPSERAAAQYDARRAVGALRSWDDHPLVGWIMDAGRWGIAAAQHLPTSETNPALIAAQYQMRLPPTIDAPPATMVYLPIEVVNTGRAVWKGGEAGGAVGLEWYWVRIDASGGRAPLPGLAGQVFLRRHVLPGDQYAFFVASPTPVEHGRYALELSLMARGHPATSSMTVGVDIVPVPRRSFFPLLGPETLSTAEVIPGVDWRPRVVIALDQATLSPGSRVRVGIEAENPSGAPARDLYVGIAPAAQPVLVFFAGRGTITTPVPIGDAARFVRVRTLPGGTSLRDHRFFEFPVSRYVMPGTFYIFAALIPQGGQRRVPWDLAAADVKVLRVLE